jgi:hypothetical protein
VRGVLVERMLGISIVKHNMCVVMLLNSAWRCVFADGACLEMVALNNALVERNVNLIEMALAAIKALH